METGKYIEKVKIFRHYTNYKGRLFVKALCDLFNDVAQTQTEQEGVDVETLNAAGAGNAECGRGDVDASPAAYPVA